MEEIDPKTPKEKTRDFIDLIYYINNNKEKQGKLKLLNFNYDYNKILYEEITYSFYYFLKGNQIEQSEESYIDSGESTIIESEFLDIKPIDINFEFIRYFDDDGWILLEEDDVIQLNELLKYDNLKIMIKAKISSEKKNKLEDKYKNINKEMQYLNNDLKNKNSIHYKSDAPLNLIVLTANPLMDNGEELRTMNDFNKIPSTIYKLFKEEDYLKYTEFLPLTMKTLEEILIDEKRRPVILHLICKSTYIVKNIESENNNDEVSKNDSDLFTNLIFEKDEDCNILSKYNSEFIDKEKLIKLKNRLDLNEKIKKNIKEITLIISTQLAENVYDLFKDFGFKNLIVQHTTLADLEFVVDFNYTFYKEIIMKKCLPINELYEMALNVYIEKENPPTFCCCFHKHKNNCDFLKNIKNELYNKENGVNCIKETIPHFYHLFPECRQGLNCYTNIWSEREKLLKYPEKYFEYSFSFHQYKCVNFFNEMNKKNNIEFECSDNKKMTYFNLCCCNEATEKHNKNYVFIKYFTKDKNNKIGFRIPEHLTKEKFFPDYEKMILLVGKNAIVFDLIKFFHSNEQYYYIYGDTIDTIDSLTNFVNAIIEYYKEKNYYLYDEPDEEVKVPNLIKTKSSPQIAIHKKLSGLYNNDNIKTKNSDFIQDISIEKKYDFIEIKLDKNFNGNMIPNCIFDKMNDNKIFLIYVEETKFLPLVTEINKKVIFLSKEKLEQLNCIKNFQKLTLENPKGYTNYYIKSQNSKDLKEINWRLKPMYRIKNF